MEYSQNHFVRVHWNRFYCLIASRKVQNANELLQLPHSVVNINKLENMYKTSVLIWAYLVPWFCTSESRNSDICPRHNQRRASAQVSTVATCEMHDSGKSSLITTQLHRRCFQRFRFALPVKPDYIAPGSCKAGVPNLFLTMYPFSILTNEHVSLQLFNR